jgi:hypothetical protein
LLEKKPDLDAAQLRTLFSTTARVDEAVSAFKDEANSAGTDTDNSGKLPNNDWGYGKLDIAQSLAALPSKCGADSVNACGGCGTLGENPGDSCNACNTGTIQCAGPDATTCATPSETCDGIDNDCDGKVDGADSDRAPACTKGATGAACSSNSDCCSNKCTGKPGKKTCN